VTDNNYPPSQPAGWYPHPGGLPDQRMYWDGAAWHTDQVLGGDVAATVSVAAEHPDGIAAVAATEAKPKRTLKWWQWGLVGVGAFLVLVIAIGSINGAGKGAGSSDTAAGVEEATVTEVTVPDVVGKTAKEAWVLLDNRGLDTTFSADEGVVIDRDNWIVQSSTPGAGATMNTGDSVVLNVKKKAPPVDTRVTVPDITGKTVAEAVAALAAVNITLTLPADVGQDWTVTSQTVPGGTKIKPGDPLSITAKAPEPVYTVAQQSAIRSAESYLSFKGFSRAGLIRQLTSEYGEGFAPEDAEFAVATLEGQGKVDWNQEAVQSAESYLSFKGFSRDGLYQQLTSEYGEQFTGDQANFALDAVGLH
jgi:hypothetical protein